MATNKTGAGAPGREMTGAEMVIEALADQGVEHIFGYPGGAVLPIYDALFQQCEPPAAHPGAPRAGRGAHGGWLRARDRTSGGGAGDLRPRRGQHSDRDHDGQHGFNTDDRDITGQQVTLMLGKDAFQEADIFNITSPVCKNHSYLVKNTNDLPRITRPRPIGHRDHGPARPGVDRRAQGHQPIAPSPATPERGDGFARAIVRRRR